MMAWAMGWRPPPPMPWMMRARSRMGRDGAMPHMKLAATKRVMQERKKVLRPMTDEAQAPAGRTMAFETR